MQIKTTQYIFPPRPKTCIPKSNISIMQTLNWEAQYKYNGVRILIKYLPSPTGQVKDTPIQLWNRHGDRLWSYTIHEDLHQQLLNLSEHLQISTLETSILDGELIDSKHKALKDTIAIWDILVKNSKHLIGTTYKERYDMITPTNNNYTFKAPHGNFTIGKKYSKDILRPENYNHKHWNNMWDLVDNINKPYKTKNGTLAPLIEGLVFKNPHGTLEPGWNNNNNSDWQCRSRVKTNISQF